MTENLPENKGTAFTRAMYGALGGAAFCGLLGMIGAGLANVLIEGGAIAASFSPLMLLAIGALVAAGTALVYMSLEKENVPVSPSPVLEKNIPSPQPEHEHMLAKEHTKNSRADGKQWVETIPSDLTHPLHR